MASFGNVFFPGAKLRVVYVGKLLALFLDGFYCYPFQLVQLAYDSVDVPEQGAVYLFELPVGCRVGSFQKVVPNVELLLRLLDAGV